MPLRRIVLSALVLALVAGSAMAQEGAPNRRPMNLIAMQGPPEPAAFARAIGLNADQTTSYANLRKAYLDATKVERDSLAAMRSRMRALRASGDGAQRRARGAGAGMPPRSAGMQGMRTMVDSVEARFADFETELAFLLTADQQNKYDAWKEAETARMRREPTPAR